MTWLLKKLDMARTNRSGFRIGRLTKRECERERDRKGGGAGGGGERGLVDILVQAKN